MLKMSNLVGCEVRITWIDVAHTPDDASLEQLINEPPLELVSRGLVIHNTDEILIIASTTGIERHQKIYRDSTRLPRSYIKKIIVLEVKNEI